MTIVLLGADILHPTSLSARMPMRHQEAVQVRRQRQRDWLRHGRNILRVPVRPRPPPLLELVRRTRRPSILKLLLHQRRTRLALALARGQFLPVLSLLCTARRTSVHHPALFLGQVSGALEPGLPGDSTQTALMSV